MIQFDEHIFQVGSNHQVVKVWKKKWYLLKAPQAFLGGETSNIYYFHPDPWGFMIQIDCSHIFQMSWFNHQVVLKSAEFGLKNFLGPGDGFQYCF